MQCSWSCESKNKLIMADDTEFLRSYFNDLRPLNRMPLQPRVYEVHDTIEFGSSMGLKICGAGGQNRGTAGWDPYRACTILDWRGPAGKPMLVASGCTGLVLEGINLRGPASIGLLYHHGRHGALNTAIRDCGFQGMDVGIQCGTAWGQATSANITYDNCHFENCGEACVRIVNAQSLEHLFLRPQFAWSPKGVDVQGGGDVSILGGGCYELGSILHLGRIGGNARGFHVQDMRPDGRNRRRTAWLSVDDTDRPQGYGVIGFDFCTQNDGQRGDTSLPLVTVPPGCRVIMRGCGFAGSFDNWAEVYGSTRPSANGELIVEHCDGISPAQFQTLVAAKSANAFYEFDRCGSIWGPRGSFSTFPDAMALPQGVE